MTAVGQPIAARRLGAYRVGRKLGSGGMASVYAALYDVPDQAKRLVALKILAGNIAHDDAEHRSFLREAALAMRLVHPNIVRTYDVGDVEGTMYLAMELVFGVPVGTHAKRAQGPTPVPIAIKIVSDVAAALHYAHELVDPERGPLGLVHQDVSPQNVIIGYDGTIKLLDFGVARLGALEGSRTESLQGKPSYLSPEQVNGKNIDRRTDVFALGIVFWELLTGTRLFKRETAAATYLAVVQDAIPDVMSLSPAVPEVIADVVETALLRDRDARHPTAEAFRNALAAARNAAGIPDVSQGELARWIGLIEPPAFGAADLEREIASAVPVAIRPSQASFPDTVELAGAAPVEEAVPDLDLPPPSSVRLAPSPPPPREATPMAVPSLDMPPPSSRRLPAAPPPSARGAAAPPSAPHSSARVPAAPAAPPSVSFGGDEDDFDMEIERNIASTDLATATSSRSSGHELAARGGSHGMRAGGLAAVSSTGLEVAHVRARSRDVAGDEDEEPTTASKVGGHALSLVVYAGTAAALVQVAHRAGGLSLAHVMPHAFDGTSAPESGVVALVSLVVAVVLGFAGLKLTPRSWSLVASGGAMLLVALAMVTVTLASTGENPTPPDGALLVPYLLPVALALVSAGVASRAGRLFAMGGIGRRLGSIPVAAIAGALAFLAYETSRLAH